MRDWKAPVIPAHTLRCRLHPTEQFIHRQARIAGLEDDINARIAHEQGVRHFIFRRTGGVVSKKKEPQGCPPGQPAEERRPCLGFTPTWSGRFLGPKRQTAIDPSECLAFSPPTKNPSKVSTESFPAPKTNTTSEAQRKVNGAAAVNLSGSEKIENSASRSAVT